MAPGCRADKRPNTMPWVAVFPRITALSRSTVGMCLSSPSARKAVRDCIVDAACLGCVLRPPRMSIHVTILTLTDTIFEDHIGVEELAAQ